MGTKFFIFVAVNVLQKCWQSCNHYTSWSCQGEYYIYWVDWWSRFFWRLLIYLAILACHVQLHARRKINPFSRISRDDDVVALLYSDTLKNLQCLLYKMHPSYLYTQSKETVPLNNITPLVVSTRERKNTYAIVYIFSKGPNSISASKCRLTSSVVLIVTHAKKIVLCILCI